MKKIAVIMAGGHGTRLWPMSRRKKPKQFQALISDRTMLQETYNRLLKVYDITEIYVATNKDYAQIVHEQLPNLSGDNIIAEPVLRDTAGGIALILAIVSARHSDAIITTFPADHIITNPDILYEAISSAIQFLLQRKYSQYIVTFGIRPSYPETGFGYIKRKKLLCKDNIFAVDCFVEKPNIATAKQYISEGVYEWNAGMFVFYVQSMMDRFQRYLPNTYQHMMIIRDAVDTQKYDNVVQREFVQIKKVSIDYAILEKDTKIAVVPLALHWSDIGSWTALKDILSDHKDDIISRGKHIDDSSKNLLVYNSGKPVITIGLKDIVVVQTDDVTLVCNQSMSQNVSAVVKRLDTNSKWRKLL